MPKLPVVVAFLLSPLVALAAEVPIAGLTQPVELAIDRAGVPHLFADDDFDLARAQGFLHARDRFFQMDATRREASGDLAELLGPGSIDSDVQLRTIGLRRAAERTAASLAPRELAFLQAYADGVNAWLATSPLPPEYAELELTKARPWVPVDTARAVADGRDARRRPADLAAEGRDHSRRPVRSRALSDAPGRQRRVPVVPNARGR